MARTHGHGNPDWTRDETVLALALYFDCGESVPSKNDPRIQELSSLLRRLPYHAEAARRDTFRNPDDVGFKLHNLRSVATGKGLSNTSKLDRQIWQEFGADRTGVKALAELIKAAIENEQETSAEIVGEVVDEFFEG